jgi:hypothetical protein
VRDLAVVQDARLPLVLAVAAAHAQVPDAQQTPRRMVLGYVCASRCCVLQPGSVFLLEKQGMSSCTMLATEI